MNLTKIDMKKPIYLALCSMAICTMMLLSSCEEQSDVTMPTYSGITVVPQQDVYHVGDKVTCSITRLTEGSANLRKSTYWFYASWWFTNPDLTADFQEFQEVDGALVATSSEIELLQTGEQKLYFFARLEYPAWDFRKIEIPVTINVVE